MKGLKGGEGVHGVEKEYCRSVNGVQGVKKEYSGWRRSTGGEEGVLGGEERVQGMKKEYMG